MTYRVILADPRLPIELPGLGLGTDGPSARGGRPALAHVVRNQVEAAYARSDLFERRRLLMDDWMHYLSAQRGKVRVRG